MPATRRVVLRTVAADAPAHSTPAKGELTDRGRRRWCRAQTRLAELRGFAVLTMVKWLIFHEVT
jgi:hypothetical protein